MPPSEWKQRLGRSYVDAKTLVIAVVVAISYAAAHIAVGGCQ